MVIVESINKIFIAVTNVINIVKGWFTNINFSELIGYLPIQFQFTVTVLVVIILSLSVVGLIKKMSFLLS